MTRFHQSVLSRLFARMRERARAARTRRILSGLPTRLRRDIGIYEEPAPITADPLRLHGWLGS